MDRCVELKPGDILYILFRGRARTRIYDTIATVVTLENQLHLKSGRLPKREVRRLTAIGKGSLIEGLKREREG